MLRKDVQPTDRVRNCRSTRFPSRGIAANRYPIVPLKTIGRPPTHATRLETLRVILPAVRIRDGAEIDRVRVRVPAYAAVTVRPGPAGRSMEKKPLPPVRTRLIRVASRAPGRNRSVTSTVCPASGEPRPAVRR